MHDADDLFEGCYNLQNISHLTFLSLPFVHGIFNSCCDISYVEDLNFGTAVGRYHVFCNLDSKTGSGVTNFRNSYLNLEKNSYPAWYFRPALHGSRFDFTAFFDECFKFIFSYRSLGLELFSKFYLSLSSERGVDFLLEMLNMKSITADLNHLVYPQSVCFPDFGTNFLHLAYHDVYREVFHDAENRCRSSTSVFKFFFRAMSDSFSHREYRYRENPLDGFTVEFSGEKKYCRYGTYKRDEALKSGKDLLQKHSGDTVLSDFIQKILDALEKIQESVSETEDPADYVRNSIRNLEEIMRRNESEEVEVTGRKFTEGSEPDPDESSGENGDIRDTTSYSTESSQPAVYCIEPSLFDSLPANLPSDISDWIDNVKDVEVCRMRLGSFEPGSYPLKIVMYTEAIKETAKSNRISEHHLFEAVLANQSFYALLFAIGLFERFEDPLKLADICRKIPALTPFRNCIRELWLQIQWDTLNHWYCNDITSSSSSPSPSVAPCQDPCLGSCSIVSSSSCVTGISAKVLDPLALAFEISWIKNRIITGGDDCEWKKILTYELSRFGGLASYPSDPSAGAKYLITTGSDRRKLAAMQTIGLNLTAVMQLSGRSMKDAYDFIQNTLAW